MMGEVLPLFAMCDVMDIGTTVDSSNTGRPTAFDMTDIREVLVFRKKLMK